MRSQLSFFFLGGLTLLRFSSDQHKSYDTAVAASLLWYLWSDVKKCLSALNGREKPLIVAQLFFWPSKAASAFKALEPVLLLLSSHQVIALFKQSHHFVTFWKGPIQWWKGKCSNIPKIKCWSEAKLGGWHTWCCQNNVPGLESDLNFDHPTRWIHNDSSIQLCDIICSDKVMPNLRKYRKLQS